MARKSRRRWSRVRVVAPVAVLFVIGLVFSFRSRDGQRIDRLDPDAIHPEVSVADEVGTGAPFRKCARCHDDLDKSLREGRTASLKFRHEVHFSKGMADCAQCHPGKSHEKGRTNTPKMIRCFMCHGYTEEAMVPSTCDTCHPPGSPDRPDTHFDGVWSVSHGKESLKEPLECAVCHEPSSCTSCHVVEMPHPEGWAKKPHADATTQQGIQTCDRCHGQDRAAPQQSLCDSCHHKEGPKDVPWETFHPGVVKTQGASGCFKCHEPDTCADCHARKP